MDLGHTLDMGCKSLVAFDLKDKNLQVTSLTSMGRTEGNSSLNIDLGEAFTFKGSTEGSKGYIKATIIAVEAFAEELIKVVKGRSANLAESVQHLSPHLFIGGHYSSEY